MLRRFRVPITTDSGGAATVYTPKVNGLLQSIAYTKIDFANGVDFTVTGETSLTPIWAESDVNASAVRAPQAASHSNAGVAALYASGGTAVNARIAIADERIKVVVAQGGATKTGTLDFTLEC